MFGYVRPLKPELRLKEYERYRAYYCGLCRAMGDCTGQCSRLTLSYDAVFLATVRCYLTNETPTVKPIRCLLHPLRRRLEPLWIAGMQQRIKDCSINTQREKLRELCRQLLVIAPDNSVALDHLKKLRRMQQ